ncbi:MAG: hypothetical protein GY788_29710 [bacterium]|nr:hypothetical protein [bacterium]
MDSLFKAIKSGLARWVIAWTLPGAMVVGIVWIFFAEPLQQRFSIVQPLFSTPDSTGIAIVVAGARFTFTTFLVSAILAYSSLPAYRILEGYLVPDTIRRRLVARQIRRRDLLRRQVERFKETSQLADPLALEKLAMYPVDNSQVLPTRLGNALRAMETFGTSRYGLDSQQMWYELLGVSSSTAKESTEDGRAPVDFFVGSVVAMSVLVVLGLIVAATTPSEEVGLAVAAVALLMIRPAYLGAVRNMKDWAMSVKALVNLGRIPLAAGLGMRPRQDTLADERAMWANYLWGVEWLDPVYEAGVDAYRRWPQIHEMNERETASSSPRGD